VRLALIEDFWEGHASIPGAEQARQAIVVGSVGFAGQPGRLPSSSHSLYGDGSDDRELPPSERYGLGCSGGECRSRLCYGEALRIDFDLLALLSERRQAKKQLAAHYVENAARQIKRKSGTMPSVG